MPTFPEINVPGQGQLYARLTTTQGTVVVRLEESKTPNTVKNFVGLATGNMTWTDPKTGQSQAGVPLYDGVRFHRVIPDFMVQVGDPLSRYPDQKGRWGTGGPGYRFEDEFAPTLKHDKPGILSMANSGPGTNGCQFFITERATPHLDGRHSVFGSVVVGQDVVNKLATVPCGPGNRPNEDQLLIKVEVFRSNDVPTG
ncbi:MAG TPA: peptidylprolyl isomerase [Polyangiaceae bacterium]|nr:peptidylprolyl isomerase [Polyangiaceae bacterium]